MWFSWINVRKYNTYLGKAFNHSISKGTKLSISFRICVYVWLLQHKLHQELETEGEWETEQGIYVTVKHLKIKASYYVLCFKYVKHTI